MWHRFSISRFSTSLISRQQSHPLHQYFENPNVSLEIKKTPINIGNRSPVHFLGRAWHIYDLRKKNWNDLHQLWFILQKERNLILTKQKEAQWCQMGQPKDTLQRLQKVKHSLKSIKTVIHERYTAYLDAQKLWKLKLEGINIYDQKVIQKFYDLKHDEKLLQVRQKIGKYVRLNRGCGKRKPIGRLRLLKERKEVKAEWSYKMKEEGNVLDMTPIKDRAYKARRKKERVLRGRQPKLDMKKVLE